MSGVHDAITAVTEGLERISKGVPVASVRDGRDYNVVGIDQIIEAVQPLLVQHKLTIVPRVTSASSWDVERTNSDGEVWTTHFAQVFVDYLLTGPDGTQEIATMVGESENNNDKSMSAALSFAEKYLYKQLFKIRTGDPDPDTQGTGFVGTTPAPAPTPRPVAGAPSRPAAAPPRPAAPAAPAAPKPTQKMGEKIAKTTNAPDKPATKPMQQAVWSISHKALEWDDQTTIDWLSQSLNIDFSGMDMDEVNGSLTYDQAKKSIDRLKKLAGQ
jgi:type IV secretory pathway VirB10-like protein